MCYHLPGSILPPLTGLGWMGGLLAQGLRWRSTPAYELAAPNGAPSQDVKPHTDLHRFTQNYFIFSVCYVCSVLKFLFEARAALLAVTKLRGPSALLHGLSYKVGSSTHYCVFDAKYNSKHRFLQVPHYFLFFQCVLCILCAKQKPDSGLKTRFMSLCLYRLNGSRRLSR